MVGNPQGPGGTGGTEIDSTVARSARIYNCLLGGTDNFPVDREAAAGSAAAQGGWERARSNVRAQRAFLARAVRHLAAETSVRQFLDVGCGIPADEYTHEIVQAIAPEARIVYVDHDPIVATHRDALLASTPEGATAYLEADVRDPEGILTGVSATLDLTRPVGLLLLGVLHHIAGPDDPWGTVARLMDGLASGSYLVVSHLARDLQPQRVASLATHYNQVMPEPTVLRDRDEIVRFFAGLEVIDPGIVPMEQWRPDDPEAVARLTQLSPAYGGLARKP